MNKADLVTRIAKDADLNQAPIGKGTGRAPGEYSDSTEQRGARPLVGYGTFSVMARAARKGRNPRTGQEIILPARKTPKFRTGKGLREGIKALQTLYVKPFMGET
jgi:DNA-binding protein HU-beta